jgi:acetylglutamate kinase
MPSLLVDLCQKGYVPVVSSIGASRDGELFNVNADTLAAHLAGRLRSPRLIIAGATAGVLESDGSTIAEMTLDDMDELVAKGGATAGMVAKLAACRHAIGKRRARGVRRRRKGLARGSPCSRVMGASPAPEKVREFAPRLALGAS